MKTHLEGEPAQSTLRGTFSETSLPFRRARVNSRTKNIDVDSKLGGKGLRYFQAQIKHDSMIPWGIRNARQKQSRQAGVSQRGRVDISPRECAFHRHVHRAWRLSTVKICYTDGVQVHRVHKNRRSMRNLHIMASTKTTNILRALHLLLRFQGLPNMLQSLWCISIMERLQPQQPSYRFQSSIQTMREIPTCGSRHKCKVVVRI